MSAHKPKPTITPALVDRFAAYYANHITWGVLHVSFDDGNYDCACVPLLRDDATDEERAIATIHDSLTESQRRRLRNKAEVREREMWKARRG